MVFVWRELESASPLVEGFFFSSDFPVRIAEVVIDDGVERSELDSFFEVFDGFFVFFELEVCPSDAVENGVVVWAEGEGLFEHIFAPFEIDISVDPAVPEVIEDFGSIWVEVECEDHVLFCSGPTSELFECHAAIEVVDPVFFFWIVFDGVDDLVVCEYGVGIIFCPTVYIGDGKEEIDIVGLCAEEFFEKGDGFIDLSFVVEEQSFLFHGDEEVGSVFWNGVDDSESVLISVCFDEYFCFFEGVEGGRDMFCGVLSEGEKDYGSQGVSVSIDEGCEE